MRHLLPLMTAASLLAACPEPDSDGCTPDDEVFVWADEDGDGFGVEPIGYVCVPGANQARNNVDCDDSNPDVNPEAEEQCDLLDNNCNGRIDETHPKTPWYPDLDGDGYGSFEASESACQPPGPEFLTIAGDCDDSDPGINPEAAEVCNGGIDDDCDGFADDADAGVDPLTYSQFWPDTDGDTYGDERGLVEACESPGAVFVTNGDDCNDDNDIINPDNTEICNGRDDDCDDLIDDEDPSIDPATQQQFFADYDGDGFGDANQITLACRADPDSGASTNDLDCDDTDPQENIDQDWAVDNDGDGVGNGNVVGFSCERPAANTAPDANGVDCDDGDPTRFPGNPEICNDGIDQDCDLSDTCKSCQDWLVSDPSALSGVYTIQPATAPSDVWCDMDTDGGGWTLVASSSATFDDESAAYSNNLQTLEPSSSMGGIWNGMRPLVTDLSDIRFTCKLAPSDANMAVDLSFYDVAMYREITSGTDSASCFFNGGVNASPERRNNLSGNLLAAGNAYNSGVLEGEDSCSDTGDFTVDFDDRGMDSNQSDGTDWGEDDSSQKCGNSGLGSGAWFIFVREP